VHCDHLRRVIIAFIPCNVGTTIANDNI